MLLLIDWRLGVLYLFTIAFACVVKTFKTDFIQYGIVETKKDKYYVINKGLYNIKLISDRDYKIGDIVKTEGISYINTYEDELRKNIQFYSFESSKIGSFSIKGIIYDRINSLDGKLSSFILKLLYNENSFDDVYDIGYGFYTYILLKKISEKHGLLSLLIVFGYSMLFRFDCKFILLIFDILLQFNKGLKEERKYLKYLLIAVYNIHLLSNYSILIPLILNVVSCFDFDLPFPFVMSLVTSILFGQVQPIYLLFFNVFNSIRLFLYALSVITLLVPGLSCFLNKVLDAYSKAYKYINPTIRGKLSLISVIMLFIIFKLLPYKKYLLLYLSFLLILPTNNPLTHVSFIDVGQGDAILIKGPLNSFNVLIDTGSVYNYSKLKIFLFKEGISNIDYLLITHNDSDHNGNLDNIHKDFIIKNTVENKNDISINGLFLKNYDLGEFDNDNDNSLVYSTVINDISFLFTGDISKSAEKVFIREYGPINFDVLKVSHHGSDTASSDYFIKNILPDYAVISTSGMYNHPSETVLNTLSKYGINAYITKESGTVSFYMSSFLNFIKTDNYEFVIIS